MICGKCQGTGSMDSGGVYPWGESILVRCDCDAEETVNLMHGDCLEMMKLIPEGWVDLTVTSPPYDSLRTYNGSLDDWGPAKWESILSELWRVTAKGGVVVWVVGDATHKGSETGTSFRQALFAIQCGFNLHDTMIYSSDKPPLTHNRYEQKFEYMFVFSKGKPKTFNPIKEACTYAGQSKNARTMRQDSDALGNRSGKGSVADEKIKGNIWFFPTGHMKSTKDKKAFEHPAIFPETLAADHVQSWSNPGDVVCDPFLGSGTTGKMAVLAGRKFIGIERDDKYFAIAKKRIEDAMFGDLV